MTKLSDQVIEIARMLYEWLPNEAWRAQNLYALHALDVYGLLKNGADVRRIVLYLERIRHAEIDVPRGPELDEKTARRLVRWWNGQ